MKQRKEKKEGNKDVQDKVNEAEDTKNKRKSEMDLNDNNNAVAQSAEKEKNEKANEPDGAEGLQVTSTTSVRWYQKIVKREFRIRIIITIM